MPDETATAGTQDELGPGAYDELFEQYKWTYGLLTILIEHQGGKVKVTDEVLQGHTFASRVSVTRNEEEGTYLIEVVRD